MRRAAATTGSPRLKASGRTLVLVALSGLAVLPAASEPCSGGVAGGYPCRGVDLLSQVPLATMGAASGNVVWGWRDPGNGDEYALMGLNNGVAFVRVTDPANPVYVGKLPLHAGAQPSAWRDVKVYANHAFVVADRAGHHGMQVFDLTQLRSVTAPPVVFGESAWYGGFHTAHTLAIDEETGFAFPVGYTAGEAHDEGAGLAPKHHPGPGARGMHFVDVRSPRSPVHAGQFDDDGYVHETQCAVYRGADASYAGREICFCANEDTLTIVDVADKAAPRMVSRTGYAGVGYTHQAWLTTDHRYLLLNDELDEVNFGHGSRTRIFDVADLDAPALVGSYDGPTTAIDHNLYVKGGFVYEANYTAGLRILSLGAVSSGQLSEVAYFDVEPANDAAAFHGSWGLYPYLPSGTILVSSIERGLLVMLANLTGANANADVDGSGRVDGWDLILVGISFGKREGDPGFDARADVDRSGVVDGNDLAIVAASFGARV